MNENKKKDYYLPVVLSQIFVSSLIVLIIFFTSKSKDGFKEDFKNLIEHNLDGVEIISATEAVFDYFLSGEVLSALKVDENNKETALLNGMGGADLEFYEAAENTSFSPIFATANICPPIENGRYSSYFGYRINPINGKFRFHTGLDIAAPEGTKIRAAFSGTVTKTGYDEQAGNYIYLTHDDGFVTFYCHCSEILVETGTAIRQGETIAFVGSTGSATGPHVHFEVRKDDIRYNPVWLLEK